MTGHAVAVAHGAEGAPAAENEGLEENELDEIGRERMLLLLHQVQLPLAAGHDFESLMSRRRNCRVEQRNDPASHCIVGQYQIS